MIHVLTPSKWAPVLMPMLKNAVTVASANDLTGGDCLIGFGTGVIVPAAALASYARAYNFHAGPPEYPGRDPHHWAVYEGVESFGVTCHEMTASVDAGPIVAVERFPRRERGPQALRRFAEGQLLSLFADWAPRMADGSVTPSAHHRWSGTARRRTDLLAFLDLSGLDPFEQDRRRKAFQGFYA